MHNYIRRRLRDIAESVNSARRLILFTGFVCLHTFASYYRCQELIKDHFSFISIVLTVVNAS